MLTEKFIVPGKRLKIPVVIDFKDDRIYLSFGFQVQLKDHIKSLEGARWDPDRKSWHVDNSQHNIFQLDFLRGLNPYKRYDKPLVDFQPKRDCYKHQVEFASHILSRNYVIIAGEMGTGKTLAVIEAAEYLDSIGEPLTEESFWYVGPRAGVNAVRREFNKWQSPLNPKFITYDKLKSTLERWPSGNKPPRFVCFDESSKIKTPTAQRSKACLHLANAIRQEHGENGYVVLMSGTPAPKNPTDWWHQCEVACPGFIKEGNINKFKFSLALIEQRDGLTGSYPHLVTWLDDTKKCAKCGELESVDAHKFDSPYYDHPYEKSKNMVEALHRKLNGLVMVKTKKECLDLPDKVYEIIKLSPNLETLRIAKTIKDTATRAVDAMNSLREISDGFRYVVRGTGNMLRCTVCGGKGKYNQPIPIEDSEEFEYQELNCPHCKGAGEVEETRREAVRLDSNPKLEFVKDYLESCEEDGRAIVWAGFIGSIDLLTDEIIKAGWHVLRLDGRGLNGFDPNGNEADIDKLQDAMDQSHPMREKLSDLYPRVCVVGNPDAGGMAYTFTASPFAIYYSNSFKGEARMQSEDRGHRAGMDVNRGFKIIDLIHLGSDRKVLDNIKLKRKLQDMTLGEISEIEL